LKYYYDYCDAFLGGLACKSLGIICGGQEDNPQELQTFSDAAKAPFECRSITASAEANSTSC